MDNYIPFMKLKGSEISALIAIPATERGSFHPFFDFPRRDEKKTRDESAEIKTKEENFLNALSKTATRIKKKLPEIKSFYLDNFDLEDDLLPNGRNTYEQIIEEFAPIGMIPVIGLDRDGAHFDAITNAHASDIFKQDRIAVRFTRDDFESFELIDGDLVDLFENVLDNFTEVDVIFDCRVMKQGDDIALSAKILDFVNKLDKLHYFDRVIITGSLMTASIAGILGTKEEKLFVRPECALYERVALDYSIEPELYLGDYTCVSPEYSDTDFYVEDLQNVTTAKVMYPYADGSTELQYMVRGTRVKTDRTQYQGLALKITRNVEGFYRKKEFSFGDRFIYQCAEGIKTNATPSSIVKPLINLHIEYMVKK